MTYRRGHRGEQLAMGYLLLRGYWPVARRYKTKVGEIDLIVRRGRTLVFLEVKAHRNTAQALEHIRLKNRQRIMRAAEWFLKSYPRYQGYTYRFDSLAIDWNFSAFPITFSCNHITNAWEETA